MSNLSRLAETIRNYSCYPGGGPNYEKVCYSGDAVMPLTNVWAAPTDQTWPVTQTSLSLTTFPAKVVLHDGIPVLWQSTDTAILKLLAERASNTASSESTPRSTSASRTAAASEPSASSVSITSSASSSKSSDAPTLSTASIESTAAAATSSEGSPTAAMAGIAVGVVAVFVMSLLGLFIYMRRKNGYSEDRGNKVHSSGTLGQGVQDRGTGKNEFDGTTEKDIEGMSEGYKAHNPRVELSNEERRFELA